MSFTPDPNLHLIICYDNKSSLYLQASIMQVHEVDGKTGSTKATCKNRIGVPIYYHENVHSIQEGDL